MKNVGIFKSEKNFSVDFSRDSDCLESGNVKKEIKNSKKSVPPSTKNGKANPL
jgi:hypothetical protein